MMARRIAILLCLLCAASTVVVGAIEPSTDAWIAHDAADKRVLVQIYYGRVLVDHLRWLDCGFCPGQERIHAPSCPLLASIRGGCGMSSPPMPWIQYTSPTTDFLEHDPGAPRNAFLGAHWDKWRSPEADHFRVEVPNYIPFLIFMIYPALRLSLIARRGIRRRRGRCVCCGYDLTGNVTGVCSECGVGRCAASA